MFLVLSLLSALSVMISLPFLWFSGIEMDYPPVVMATSQKEVQSALQVAGWTTRTTTSWIPTLLNYTWSMSCFCPFLFVLFEH
jgi:hypothetical protein